MRITVDGHCDTLSKALDEELSINDEKYSFNLRYGNLPHLQCLASYVSPKYLNNKNGGFLRANSIIDKFYSEYEKNQERIILIKSKEDIENLLRSEKFGALLTIENGSAISGNLENIDIFYNRGIRIMSVTWNDDNDLACGNLTDNDTGLTELGIRYIKRLNEMNRVSWSTL
jgi:membrane dipeptidase